MSHSHPPRCTAACPWPRIAAFLEKLWPCGLFLLLLPWLVACGAGPDTPEPSALSTPTARPADLPLGTAGPAAPAVDLTLAKADLLVEPLPLRAGFPFTVTVTIHNNSGVPAEAVPVMIYISEGREEAGYSPFVQVLTVTLPTTRPVPIEVPIRWNLAGGEHRLSVQVNRLPHAWQSETPLLPEDDLADNIALLDLAVAPFDAYVSALCPGRVDVQIDPADVLLAADRQKAVVWVHNVGNRAVYNLPVVILGDDLAGTAYTPAIPPCGGTALVTVDLDRPLASGEQVIVQVNPQEWVGSLVEDDLANNLVTATAGPSMDETGLPASDRQPLRAAPQDYDFSLDGQDLEAPEPWLVIVTVHNLGTRDAAMVPIRVENAAGRKITDAVPLVQGNGIGVVAVRVGYLWTRGGTLTFTINPEKAKGALPEANRDNNVATLVLP